MKDIIIYLDGSMIQADQKLLKSLSLGILPGQGVFETMRAYCRKKDPKFAKIFQLDAHLSRLAKGLRILNIPKPISSKKMKEISEEILRCNGLRSARVRLTVWKMGKKVHVAIAAVPYESFPEIKYQKGFKAMVSSLKLEESSVLKGIKSIRYAAFLKAYQRAKLAGYEEALLLNHRGELVEGSRSNVFFVTDKVLCTPALASGCLAGITRRLVIEIAREMGIKVSQCKATLEDVLKAQESFLTNSLLEVMPLTSIQGKDLNGGNPGRLTLKILQQYRRLVKPKNFSFPCKLTQKASTEIFGFNPAVQKKSPRDFF